MQEPLVKGVWFVTARRHLVERHGEEALAAVSRRMPGDERHAIEEPLASRWYPEPVFQRALEAVQTGLTFHDDERFRAFIEASTELGVNTFLRIVLEITTPTFLFRNMPTFWAMHRKGNGTLEVDADLRRARLRCTHFPFFGDPNYRLFVLGVLTRVTELATGARPRARVVSHSKDSLEVEVIYGGGDPGAGAS